MREAGQPGENTSDTLRRALRLLDHERWLTQFRTDGEALKGEDIDAEPEAWWYLRQLLPYRRPP